MLNAQTSFSAHSFSLKSVEESSNTATWSSNDPSPQSFSSSSLQDPASGLSSLHSPIVNGSTSDAASGLVSYLNNRTAEGLRIIRETAEGFASCLAADHAVVLNPDVDSPFVDAVDVVHRLLPFHVFQQPQEDLRTVTERRRAKGKGKAHDVIRDEIEDTKFALECHRRLRKLESRFRRAKMKSGMRPCRDDQGYVLTQAMVEYERAETSSVSTELRNARNELDASQREKRIAANVAVSSFRPTYYPQASQAQYYRTYPYAFTQPYTNTSQGTTNSNFYSTPTSAPSAAPTTTSASTAIPIQLPVSSLPALHALGIVPIPAASLPPPDQPQPAAVLRGSTSNGTILSLEINVSLLQSPQVSGLAYLLNSMMSRSTTSGQGNPSSTTGGQPSSVATSDTAASSHTDGSSHLG
ncbi:uncharacterized protein BJ212DRAFT_1384434 [Suillus subaureus]|uniref:GLTSCR protein conserved domain-containing protein n=1 Tax=Suillus subaureus TaxID=48587 RepID=A0A9P7E1B9_9AGAM|nr:uncharacterized protein BJ212DRAFT_1384434 [Suillus subaureus]KAG1808267.1 hypothetical protein BJ212DRAFT_1384434 [Suillus subaureus]